MLTYRPDVDGLRALAVLAVIAYHAGIGLPGGYVGVDVFFVISGFLITSLIVKDLEAGRFSLANFWERRIRRIWPLALLVTCVVLLAGWVLLLPKDYEVLATDALAQTTMVSNVRFWLSSGYFAAAAEQRPLLHTWSLAVEEQFYILFPPVLMLIWRWSRAWTGRVLLVLGAISLGLSVWAVDRHPSAAFYLLPTRAWELVVGALLAVWRPPPLRSALSRNFVGLFGLVLVLAPFLVYGKTTPFPGLHAVPPVLGAALLIYVGASDRASSRAVVTRALSIEPLRVIGLMSYSLYLWHWPILAYMHATLGGNLGPGAIAIALIATCALSVATWRLVETPLRRISSGARLRHVAAVAGAVSGVVIVACIAIRQTEGFDSRFPPEIVAYGSPGHVSERWSGGHGVPVSLGSTKTGRPDFLLWGDSHGMAISGALNEIAATMDMSGFAALENGTVPVPGLWCPAVGRRGRARAAWSLRTQEWIRKERPRHVVLVARWSLYVDGGPNGSVAPLIAPLRENSASRDTAQLALASGLNELVRDCVACDATVWLLREVPLQQSTPEARAIQAHLLGDPLRVRGVTRAEHLTHQSAVDRVIEALEHSSVQVVDLAGACFDDRQRSVLAIKGRSTYADDDHLSPLGAGVMLHDVLHGLMAALQTDTPLARGRSPLGGEQANPKEPALDEGG